MNARELALSILETSELKHVPLDILLDKRMSASYLDTRDRRFLYELVYGVMRNRIYLDWLIDHFVSSDQAAKNPYIRQVLRLGIYQLVFMDRVPDHAAVNECVNAVKKGAKIRFFGPLVNATLRNIAKSKNSLPKVDPSLSIAARMSIEYSHPEWLIERWLARFGMNKTQKLCAFNNQKPLTYIRRKYKSVNRAQFEAELRGTAANPQGFSNLFYELTPNIIPEQIPAFSNGDCTVQSPSSGWIAAMLDIHAGDRILDACAAPGGKTTLCAELATATGSVVACDVRVNRLDLVIDNAKRMQLANIRCVVADSRKIPLRLLFDKVLIDAPCSATGVLNRHPDARYVRSFADLVHRARLQREILEACAPLVRDNGVLVYATCSLEPEENEQVIESFCAEHPEFIREAAPATVPQNMIDKDGYLRILPFEHSLDGFFAARLVKKLST